MQKPLIQGLRPKAADLINFQLKTTIRTFLGVAYSVRKQQVCALKAATLEPYIGALHHIGCYALTAGGVVGAHSQLIAILAEWYQRTYAKVRSPSYMAQLLSCSLAVLARAGVLSEYTKGHTINLRVINKSLFFDLWENAPATHEPVSAAQLIDCWAAQTERERLQLAVTPQQQAWADRFLGKEQHNPLALLQEDTQEIRVLLERLLSHLGLQP